MNFNSTPSQSLARQLALSLLVVLTSLSAQGGQRFQPNAAGDEITDSHTGLVWRRCTEGQNWNGQTCTGTYQAYAFDGALARAQSQADSSGLAWRLPNVKELKSLVKPAVYSPAINTAAFPGTPNTYFWSATPVARDASAAWVVFFIDGFVGTTDVAEEKYGTVRLVRTAP